MADSKPKNRHNGILIEEFLASTAHIVEDGEVVDHNSDADDGRYTGRFRFMYNNRTYTPWHRERTAPKWLLRYWQEATAARQEDR